jgi:hypothetical protein
VEFKQLVLLILEGLESAAVACGGLFDDVDVLLGERRNRLADLGRLLRGELERPIERRNLDLDLFDVVVAGVAVAAVTSASSDATEVLIDSPVLAAMLPVDQAGSADIARQRTLEVVRVLAFAIAG